MWVAVCYIVQDAKLWQTRACGGWSSGKDFVEKKGLFGVGSKKKKNGVLFHVDAQNIPSQNLQMLY